MSLDRKWVKKQYVWSLKCTASTLIYIYHICMFTLWNSTCTRLIYLALVFNCIMYFFLTHSNLLTQCPILLYCYSVILLYYYMMNNIVLLNMIMFCYYLIIPLFCLVVSPFVQLFQSLCIVYIFHEATSMDKAFILNL